MVSKYVKPRDPSPPPKLDVFHTFPKPPPTHFSSYFECESCPKIKYCLYPDHIENIFSKHFVMKTELLQSLAELLQPNHENFYSANYKLQSS